MIEDFALRLGVSSVETRVTPARALSRVRLSHLHGWARRRRRLRRMGAPRRDSPSSPRRTSRRREIATCATNFCAEAASRLNVSTPTAQMSRSLTRKRADCFAETGRVHRPFRIPVEEPIDVADTGVPTGMHRHERTGRDAPVAFLPLEDVICRHERIGILGGAIANADDDERRNEPIDRKPSGWDSPGHEMRGRIDVRARVLVDTSPHLRRIRPARSKIALEPAPVCIRVAPAAPAKTGASDRSRRETLSAGARAVAGP